jgi:hypothetical protein
MKSLNFAEISINIFSLPKDPMMSFLWFCWELQTMLSLNSGETGQLDLWLGVVGFLN